MAGRDRLHAVEEAIRQLRAEGYREASASKNVSMWSMGDGPRFWTALNMRDDSACMVKMGMDANTATDITDVYM